MRKVLLDTDIGGDIDDAACLAYLLRQPRCELLGITTVSGEPVERARMARALCRAAGREVPVYPGTAAPLLVGQRQPHAQQAARLGAAAAAGDLPQGEAIDFLRWTIRAHPGQVTLLAIGPLTNVALLFAVDPELPALLAGLVAMMGWFNDRPPHAALGDWNALCDPHAAAMVCRAPLAAQRIVPLDVTRHLALPEAEFRRRCERGLLRAVRDLADPGEDVVLHDPLAAVTLFEPGLCAYRRATVEVDLGGPATLGMTHLLPGARHEVAVAVDPDAFFDHYFSITA